MAGQVFTQMAAYSFLLLILWNQGIVRDESLGWWKSVIFPEKNKEKARWSYGLTQLLHLVSNLLSTWIHKTTIPNLHI